MVRRRSGRMLGPTASTAPRAVDEAEAAAVAPTVGDDRDIAPEAEVVATLLDEDDYDRPAAPWREAIGGAEGDPLPLDELPTTSSKTGSWADWVTPPIDPYERDEYGTDGDRTYDAGAVEYSAASARGRLARRSRNRDEYREDGRRGGAGRVMAGIAAVAVTVGVVVVVIGVNVGAGASKTSSAAPGLGGTTNFAVPVASTTAEVGPAGPLIAPETFAHTTRDCTRTRSASLTSGAGKGDDKDAGGVILKFEWAYYVDRDATAIYNLMAPGAKLGASVAELQTYLGTKLPKDTKYCVRVTPHGLSGSAWQVDIDEQRPGGAVDHLAPQIFTTTSSSGGRTVIISVADK